MRLPRWVPALVLVLALVEVVLLVRFADAFGAGPTVAVLGASGVLALVVLIRLRRRRGERGLDLVSALLLLVPGLLSSLAGLLLLVPPVRATVRERWWAWLQRSGIVPDLPRHTVIPMQPLEQHDAPPGSGPTGGAPWLDGRGVEGGDRGRDQPGG